MNCPNCQEGFEKGRLYRIPLRTCPSCEGLLLVQKYLPDLLEAITLHHFPNISRDQVIQPLPHKMVDRICPSCDRRMETYGYLGTKTVMVDSCFSCKHLFLDKEELGVMAALYSKTNKRSEMRRMERASYRSDLLTSHIFTEAINRAFYMGYMLG